MKDLFLSAAILCAALASGATIDYSRFSGKPAKGEPLVVIPDKTVVYRGFYIDPMPGTSWSIVPGKQRNNGDGAFWVIVDPANRLHTTFATIGISPKLPEQHLKDLSLEKLQSEIVKKLFSDHTGRLTDIKVTSVFTTVNGVKFADISGSATDTGSKHSAKPLKQYIRILSTITTDGRIFSIAISERTPNLNALLDKTVFDSFINAVHLGQTVK